MRSTRRTDRYHWAWHRWARYVAQRMILRPIVFGNTRVTVEGERNLKGLKRPYIVVANHSSHLDAPLMFTGLPWRITRHMATATAADYFYNSRWRSTLTSFFFNSYPVDRGRGKARAPGLSVRLLRQDIPLLIFPEGTRSRTGEMADFTPGAAALARSLRVPVVPVALVGAYDAMPPGRNWPKSGRLPVKMVIGKPVEPKRGERLAELNDRLTAQVRQMHSNQTPYVLVPETSNGNGNDERTEDVGREETDADNEPAEEGNS